MANCIVLLVCTCFVALLDWPTVQGANVLFSALYGEGSHFLVASVIGASLVKRGHNVTFLISNAYEERASDPKYSNFSFEIFTHPVPVDDVHDMFDTMNKLAFVKAETQMYIIMQRMAQRLVDDCEAVLTDSALMKRMEAIDTIVMDTSWPCALLIRAVLEKNRTSTTNISMIALCPTPPHALIIRWAGSPFHYAYQPEMTTGYSNKMTLLQRTHNIFQSFLMYDMFTSVIFSPYKKMYDKVGLSSDFDLFRAYQDFDLYLLNIQFSAEFPYALTPNIITVGGLTARPAGQLNEDLEEFMNSSEDDGVVVFTLGTYLGSITSTRPDLVQMFAAAFRRIPQKVVWQLKGIPAFDLPANVKTLPWLPQNDLLGHPKTRVFMSQGGNNGFQEASYHGVPVVVIPLQIDQYDIAARIEARGMGRKIDKQDLSADLIYDTLIEVLSNPTYSKTAKQVSAINKDQPMRAPDRAAFWIEHVIKFGGAHLRSPANELSFIQYHLLDVIALLAIVLISVCLLSYYFLRFCFSLFCRFLTSMNGKTKRE